jgi:hypothetical protein
MTASTISLSASDSTETASSRSFLFFCICHYWSYSIFIYVSSFRNQSLVPKKTESNTTFRNHDSEIKVPKQRNHMSDDVSSKGPSGTSFRHVSELRLTSPLDESLSI